jgi:hypothetical protein
MLQRGIVTGNPAFVEKCADRVVSQFEIRGP